MTLRADIEAEDVRFREAIRRLASEPEGAIEEKLRELSAQAKENYRRVWDEHRRSGGPTIEGSKKTDH